MTIKEAQEFINYTSWKGSSLGLSRIIKLMGSLGDPHKKLKFVHIAGTNGKGSTAAMLSSVLSEAGYTTGLYTSPYIHSFGERIQINGVPISDAEIIGVCSRLKEHVDLEQDPPTTFEITTAMAFLHFYECQCDVVVLEVGLGGRLDATNIIDTPELAIITAIDLDHMNELGDTIEKISAEKAGIIKKDGFVVSYPQVESVKQVIRDKCGQCAAKVVFVDDSAIIPLESGLYNQRFDFFDIRDLTIPLIGEYQLRNAAVVITAINVLRGRGWNIDDSSLQNGLLKTSWPARFEVMRHSPVFIVDGAHNRQGVQSAVDNLLRLFPNKKFLFLFGVLEDKDYMAMVDILIPHASRFLTLTPDDPRAIPAEDLAEFIRQRNASAAACESAEQGVRLAIESSDSIICALGSLYMIGHVRECLL